MKPGILCAALFLVAEPALTQQSDQPAPAIRAEQILANMPENSDFRCVGISLVAAALLEGESLAGSDCDRIEDLSQQIYDGVFKKARLRFHATLCLADRPASITSREGMNALATAVTDRYKQRHFELIATAPGRRRLLQAETHVVRTSPELDALLDADADHAVPFLVAGTRRFPDGEIKTTNHAVLITKNPDGEKVIYDPNDPGQPIPCTIQASSDGLLIKWTCRYRDTNMVTAQQYRIIELDRFFREALAQD